jgi:hypothetical protein
VANLSRWHALFRSRLKMEQTAYAELVERMRKAQTQYFKTRSSIDLNISKKLEREVDEATESILGPGRIKNQTSLF